ncbi:ABC transporter ATP-binding protein [Saccharopolyspora dendranthemae]|uniref:Peptide/nickel transport system ATP-binding protein n=1 Tax=Saccharopolyspora dendranthemae TaxID=1181886 RepID=A0A561U3J0_9PSEU|nr:ATP-binding cassette domain-containing protein [Saccharopolyspora dendranthemae]TWF93926.1 peptide/nickel transport system ATP-binding protein [Saccharopolyspora dendranthemae]
MTEPILSARGLRATAGEHVLLDGIDLDLRPGTALAVIGRSGAGKTTLGWALQGESPPGIALSGEVRLHGTELLELTDGQRRGARAGTTSVLPQHPAAVLNPMRRIGKVLRELATLRHPRRAEQDEAVRGALATARLDPEPALLRRFPHQLSGGQQQRVALAQALITEPGIVILDEPTTGADTLTKSETADMLEDLAARGTALVLLTHDLPLARRLAHDTLVLHEGRIVESGPGTRPLHAPAHARSREILAAEPVLTADSGQARHRPDPVLRAEGLGHRAKDGAPLLTGVELAVRPGWCAAIVGPSGAGKTTLARCLAGLTRPDAGRVLLGEAELAPTARQRPREHRRQVQHVHQDARAAFDPHRPVIQQVARTAELLRNVPRGEALAEAEEALADLGMDPVQARRGPAGLSGGQLQRAAVARGLLAHPSVLICDEITSALDVINQSELFRALEAAKSTLDVGILLISHDFAAVSELADEVHLMQDGCLVESATPHELLTTPRSRTARALVAAAREHHQPPAERGDPQPR